jgi:predicted SnoaL-like aldol condensation-catalyzing enzyme
MSVIGARGAPYCPHLLEGEGFVKKAVVMVLAVLAVGVANVVTAGAQGNSALEKTKVLAQRFHLDMIAKGQLEIAEQIIAPDCVIHLPSRTMKGPEGARQVAAGDLKAFPKGIKLTHDVVFAEGNLVAFHWILAGTRESGETTELEGIDIVRVANGKISEMWIEYHNMKQEKPSS